MKNFSFTSTFLSLILAVLYFSKSLDSNPVSISDFRSGPFSIGASEFNSRPNDAASGRLEWQPVKTAVIPIGNSLDLSGQNSLTNPISGDISWVATQTGYAALKPTKVQFFKLGQVNIDTLTYQYLNALQYNCREIPATPVSSSEHPNELTQNTLIACKTTDGKYYLIEIAKVNWGDYWDVQLSVYHGTNALIAAL